LCFRCGADEGVFPPGRCSRSYREWVSQNSNSDHLRGTKPALTTRSDRPFPMYNTKEINYSDFVRGSSSLV
jgi:hypothetical protein